MKIIAATFLLMSIATLSSAGESKLLESCRKHAIRPVANAPLDTFLPHTVWHPVKKDQPMRSVTFTADGRMHVSVKSGGGMIHYTPETGGNSILCKFSGGKLFRVDFSKDRKMMTIMNQAYALQPELHSKFSELVSR